jgi:4-amino-4-deoxy-L-arabinose transferase-like glycosyltransferase
MEQAMDVRLSDGRAGEPFRPRAAHLALLAAVCCAMFLYGIGTLPLMDPDESRCALIVKEMQQTGQWLMPHLMGKPYFDKPAPFFWLAAGGQWLTGNVEAGGRLVAALAALLAVIVTYLFVGRAFGRRAGLLAGLVLATSMQFWFMARWYRMDMPFTAGMWAALWWFWRGEDLAARSAPAAGWALAARPASARRRQWCGFYAFCGIATMFKGPAGLFLPAVIVAAYFLLTRQGRRLTEFFSLPGIAIYLLIAAPWYVAVSLTDKEYAYQFFVRQNLERYAGGSSIGRGHRWSGALYVPIVIVGLLPWSIYLPGAVARLFPRRWRARADRPAELLLWLAALIPIVFFALGRTHLVGYVLPAFLPLAGLVAVVMARWADSAQSDRLLRVGAWALAATVPLLPAFAAGVEIHLHFLDAWIALPGAFCLLAAWRMVVHLRRDQRAAVLGWAVAGTVMALLFGIGHTSGPLLDLMSARRFAQVVPADLAGSDLVCTYGKKRLSFLLHTHAERTRIAKVIGFEDENAQDLPLLAKEMASTRRVFCLITGKGRLAEVQRACLARVHILQSGGDRWLVTNQPSGAGEPGTRNSEPGRK